MTSAQLVVSGLLQLSTTSKLFERAKLSQMEAGTTQMKSTGWPVSTMNSVANRKVLKKITSRVEYKMVLNSLILFLFMAVIAFTYLLFSFRIGFDWPLSIYYIHCYCGDFFSLINPILLIALSGTIRTMLTNALKCRKYKVEI